MKAPNPRRLELVKLSRAFKPLVQAGKFTNINAAVVAYYTQQTGKQDWRTFKGWKDAGFSVVKGATGFPIWAQPRPMGAGQQQEGEPANLAEFGEGSHWFPVCYLFHDGQVMPSKPGDVHATASPEVAAMIDPAGTLQESGLLGVAA